jgi:hypothetical protein
MTGLCCGFVKKRYRIAALTREKTIQLNRHNRSQMDSQRLARTEIRMSKAKVTPQ